VFLCEPRNTDALTAAISTLANDGELRERLSVGALALAEEWFSWPAALRKTMIAYGFEQEKLGAELSTF
jgi:glycosyltransferase involved in cell wall biosynthesis